MSDVRDVVVIGAGPAGSTTAALLAEQGFSVLVLERDEFPRFHIGESLLPSGLPVLEQLGVTANDTVFQFKRGAQFLREHIDDAVSEFDFSKALAGPPRHAWHVDRAQFDTMLRDNAVERGATVWHGVEVTNVHTETQRATLHTSEGELYARFVVDASGQQRFMARQQRSAQPYARFGKAAAFTHFHDITDEAMGLIGDGSDIRIMMAEGGWQWVIQLPGRRLSIGFVKNTPGISNAHLDSNIEQSPFLSAITRDAMRADTHIANNFSYKNESPSGLRYACVGDAACFLDPVFSSGVSLAMQSASMFVSLLVPTLREETESTQDWVSPYITNMEEAYQAFGLLIHRFYNTRMIDNLMFGSPPDGSLHASVTSMLAGDVWRQDNEFKKMLLNSRVRL